MQLETVSSKHINELEKLVMELQQVIRKAGLQNESVTKALHDFEDELGKVRRARFDAVNSEYSDY